MIRNKIAQAVVLIARVEAEQKKVAQQKRYEAFLAELEKNLMYLNSYQQTFQVLNGYNPRNFSAQDTTFIVAKFNAMLATLEGGSEPPNKVLVKPVVDEVKRLEAQLKADWQDYVEHTSKDILGVLDNIKGVVDDPVKFNDVINRLKSLKNKWPVSQRELKDLTGTLEEGRQIIQELNAGEEVQKFLGLVSTRQARLSDMKPEILDWLQSKKLTGNLKITFANS